MKKIALTFFFVILAFSLVLTGCAPFRGPGSDAPNHPYSNAPDDQQNNWYGQGGGMGPGMMDDVPMMNSMMGYYSGIPSAISHDDAMEIFDRYLASLDNNAEFEIDEFEEYSHNFYISLIEKSTGKGAVEIIIDRYSGSLQPEPHSMMWNEKYGMNDDMMSGMNDGMMGGNRQNQNQERQMPITEQEAMEIAQDFLDVVYPGTEAFKITEYYGYYTIMTETEEGEHYGMLSVNGYSGEIWYHNWHGMFISAVGEHGH